MYNENSIVTLSQGEAFRKKIGMYLSANLQEAINLGLRELIVNVQDEYEQYKPKNPEVIIKLDTKNRIISVTDNMRGIPVGKRDDGINSLTAAFLLSHSGGKHEEGAYSSAIGCNGIGNKCVCHTAEKLKVVVNRDNKKYTQEFTSTDKGATPLYDVKEEKSTTKETGTYIEYIPDKRVYGDIFIDIESLENMLTEMAYFARGLKIVLIVDKVEKTFYSKNGLVDALDGKDAVSKKISYTYEAEDCKVELALQFINGKGEIKSFANGLNVKDGGAFMTGFKNSVTKTMNALSKQNFVGDNIRKCLTGIVSVKVKNPQFSNQMKTELANPEARKATSTATSNALKEYAKNEAENFEKVINLITKYDKAEKMAENARKSFLSSNSEIAKESKKKAVLPKVLIDCQEHGKNSTLYIVEGESAAGNIINCRNPSYQAIYQLRGKILNVLKASDDRALKSEVLEGLHKALGCGYGDSFNSTKLRYGKIVLLTDEDYDGYSIRCLLIVFFYYYYPQLLKNNKIFIGRTPLYCKDVKGKRLYAFTEEEVENFPKTGELLRRKGLGALTEEDISNTIFSKNPFEQVLEFKQNEYEDFVELLETFMGDNIEKRREYVEQIDF